MKEALVMAKELLVYEPDNRMIKEYLKYIMEYIAQGTTRNAVLFCYVNHTKNVVTLHPWFVF